MDNTELKKRIVNYRAKHNLSMKQFAKLCGVTTLTISNIETDATNASRLTTQKILNVIGEDNEND